MINFDAELRVLRHKKLQLDVQLKHADLRYITWYEELLILNDVEKTENDLQGRVTTLHSEKEATQVCRPCVPGLKNTADEWSEKKVRHQINGGFSLLPLSTDLISSAKFRKARNSW